MSRFANLRSYMLLSVVAAIFVSILVLASTENWSFTLIGFLITFIVTVVVVATLDLSFKPDSNDPNRPRLR
jgi:hypothetical protein